MIEIDARKHFPLGMPAADFLRDFWHKRPLLCKTKPTARMSTASRLSKLPLCIFTSRFPSTLTKRRMSKTVAGF